MIIVEGPDGAGKTTLIKTLVEATGLPVAPRVVSKDAEAMVDLVKWTEDNVQAGFQPLIFDRHRLISEPIYGPVLRAELTPEFMDTEWFYTQLDNLYACNPFIIYCLPSIHTVWANIMSNDDNAIFHSRMGTIQAIYGAYLNKGMTESIFRNRTFTFDYNDPIDVHRVLPNIISRIKEHLHRV